MVCLFLYALVLCVRQIYSQWWNRLKYWFFQKKKKRFQSKEPGGEFEYIWCEKYPQKCVEWQCGCKWMLYIGRFCSFSSLLVHQLTVFTQRTFSSDKGVLLSCRLKILLTNGIWSVVFGSQVQDWSASEKRINGGQLDIFQGKTRYLMTC